MDVVGDGVRDSSALAFPFPYMPAVPVPAVDAPPLDDPGLPFPPERWDDIEESRLRDVVRLFLNPSF